MIRLAAPFGLRVRRIATALACLSVGLAAAPLRAQPRLTPSSARHGSDAIARDLRTLGEVRQRIDALIPDSTPELRYQRSKAHHWMTFVESEYADNERGPVIEAAFKRVVTLVTSVEMRTTMLDEDPALPGTVPVRPDLHARLAMHRARSMPCQPEALGEFAVKLLTAAHMPGAVGRMNAAAAIRRAEVLDEILQATPCTPAVIAVTPSDFGGVSVAPIPERDVVVVNDAGRTIVIPGIVRFAFARSALTPKTRALLDRVARNLRDATAVRIEIIGHTDRHGSAKANRRLALRRASSVRRYLARAGLSTVQIVILSRGESALLDRRHTAQADARNRRAEIRVFTSGGASIQFEPDTAGMRPLRRTRGRAPRRTSTPPPPVTAR